MTTLKLVVFLSARPQFSEGFSQPTQVISSITYKQYNLRDSGDDVKKLQFLFSQVINLCMDMSLLKSDCIVGLQ
jgi:hypothetical protein